MYWRQVNPYYHDLIEGYLSFYTSGKDSVLVLGCGGGEIFDRACWGSAVGIDVDKGCIDAARERFGNRRGIDFYHVEDYESLGEMNRHFDWVVLYDLIAELGDIQGLMENVRRVIGPRSRLILNFHSHLWSPVLHGAERLGLKRPPGEVTWVTIEDMLNFLELTGFELIGHEKCILLPKKVFGLGNIVNRWVAPLPVVGNLCLENVVMARPRHVGKEPDSVSVTVVIPARNEAGNIENAVKRMPRLGRHTEIIFVEGHSNDETWEEIQRVEREYQDWDIRSLKQPGKGKADAVQLGFREAKGNLLMILDADLTVSPEDLSRFYQAILENKGEFINGSRLVYPLEKQAMQFLNMLANKLFGWMFTWLLGQRYRDTLCGTKVLWRDDYERIVANRGFFGDFDPFGDFDLIFGATKLGLKTIEVPIRYKERTYGTTNIRRFRHGMLLFRMFFLAAFRLKFRRL